MEELISVVVDLETEHFILVALVMSLSVSPQGPVRIMGSGLERHQLVKVSFFITIEYTSLCQISMPFISSMP